MVASGGVQADTYGLCGVVHCLLYGKYMEVEKTRGVGDGAPTYRPKAQFKRWFCSHGMPTRVVKRLSYAFGMDTARKS